MKHLAHFSFIPKISAFTQLSKEDIAGNRSCRKLLGCFRFEYEIRHFWRQLLASSRADVIKS